MFNHSSSENFVVSPSMSSNAAESPTPIVSVVSVSIDQKTAFVDNSATTANLFMPSAQEGSHHEAERRSQDSKSKGILGQLQHRNGDGVINNPALEQQLQQHDSRSSMYIPSPPAIANWHTMSTAATTITSNKHHPIKPHQQQQRLPYMILPMVVPACRLEKNCYHGDVIIDDDIHNNSVGNTDVPPVCEIRIPSQQRLKRPADVDDDEVDDDDDADTTTSTQNLSRDEHHQKIDYKGMYFTSQTQNYTLHEQLSWIQEDNRKLKRQLIEMQKQLYTYSRNKRPATSSFYHSDHQHRRDVAPWSIPISSTLVQQHQPQYQPQSRGRVLMVRQQQPQHEQQKTQYFTGNTENSTVTPTADVTAVESSPSKGVSMSVSSEEGNTIL